MKRSLSESTLSLAIINDLEDIKKSENNIVLFGSVGNGKTLLLNKACGANYFTADNGYSCTRNVQFDYSLKYDMVIIDFPGLNAVQDIIGHLRVQKTALSTIPVRMICFVIKYSPRNDDFERELGQMLSIFSNYIKNVTIIITKSENINMKRKEEIKFLFKNKFEIENILFTTLKTDGIELCDEFNKLKSKMDNIKQILVKTRDLAKTIPSLYNKDMAEEREKFEDKFYDALEEFKKEVNNAQDPDLKRAIYFAFKDFKTLLLEEYTNAIRNKRIGGKEPDMDSVIAEVLMFDNNIFNEFNEFRKQIESQLEIKSSNYNGEYNRFKKCPHCGLIWFKIKGCDSVQCGKRTKTTDKIVGKYKNYIVRYVNNKIVIRYEDLGSDDDIDKRYNIQNNNMIRIDMNSDINIRNNNIINQVNLPITQINDNVQVNININQGERNLPQINVNNIQDINLNNNNDVFNEDEFIGLTTKEKKENEEREKNGKIKINPLGCGRQLDWKEMEDCSDEVIEKLKEISVDDYYSGLLKINEKINK